MFRRRPPKPAPEKPAPKRRRLLVGCLAVVGVVLACGIIAQFAPKSSSPTPEVPLSDSQQASAPSPTATTETLAPTSEPPTPEPTLAEAAPTVESPPTATEVPVPTSTPEPTAPAVPQIASKGLGVTREAWEATMGQGVHDLIYWRYGDVTVSYYDERVSYVERQWSNPVAPEVALAEGMSYMPDDAQEVQVYTPDGRPETTVHVYFSPSLAPLFSPERFIGGEPGNFTIQFKTFDGAVPVMMMGLGNNP